ncbi:retrotransposon protein, putative, ty1-copia subclass [Tanacetum coccineum]|uniref:Retrotransposon protein, putative, ty1-copia subclass n=1 Tax=Tanacetum coccineum TaxID=301880 RepID=A0ABQ4YXA1_9ASTR
MKDLTQARKKDKEIFEKAIGKEKRLGEEKYETFMEACRGIASVAIIDRQLPFEYTIASRSTDVMVWNAVYDAHNKVACLMLGSMTPELHRQFENVSPYEMLQEFKSMFEKQAEVEWFDLIQTFHACKQEEGKPVGQYVLKMKGYVEQLERLGYVLPQDLSVGLILNGLTSDFTGFAATPQVMAIQSGRIHRANKKSLNAKRKGKGKGKGKDKKVGHCKRNCPAYLAELIKKKKQVGTASSLDIFGLRGARKLKQGALYLYVGNGVRAQVEAIGSFDLVLPNGLVFKNEVENQLGKTIKALRSDRGGEYISQEFKDYLKACGIVQQLTPPYTPQHNGVSERRNRTLLDMVRSMMNLTTLPLSFWDYALESAARILNMVPTKKVDKTPYELWFGKVPNLSYLKETMGYYFYFPPENKIVVARYAEFFEKNLLSQEVSGRAGELEEIQDEDTSPSEITSEIPMEVEGFEPPQEEEAPVRRSPKLDKWLDAMNTKMKSMKDNQVWCLVDLPPNGTVGRYKSIAAFYDYEIWQMDVKTVFLNGFLDEDIYMVQPEGFVDPKHHRKAGKLQDLSKHQKLE